MKMKRIMASFLAMTVLVSAPAPIPAAQEPVNLVPDEMSAETANYVCTWNIQDWVAWHEGKGNNATKRDVVDPAHLFDQDKTDDKDQGWISSLYPEVRSDLYFLLDDGWDLPYGTRNKNSPYFASQVLPTDKFPADEWGETPQERLKTLNEKVKAEGWKGTGIWICAQESSAYPEYVGADQEEFWKMRLEWSKYAGIAYWKIDWGNYVQNIEWRRKLSEWAEEIYPELIIEHIVGGCGGFNQGNNGRMNEGVLEKNVEFGAFSDVFRTYDVLDNLATPITLERAGQHLLASSTEKGSAMGLINAEDEMYLSAALGLSIGVMRFDPNVTDDTMNSGAEYFAKGTEPNTYFAGAKSFVDTKATRNRLDEVARTVYWQRIAPPYEVGAYDTVLSNEYLTDDWTFTNEEPSWEDGANYKRIEQKAPAAIARGINLPSVTVAEGDDKPYLTASRNPNGAISIAALERTHSNTGYQPVESAEVSLNAGDLTGPIGVFGHYKSLTLTFNQDISDKTILAQDLMGKEAEDITGEDGVEVDGNTVTFSGELLKEIGLSAGTKGDTSDPGLVILIGEAEDFAAAPQTNERIAREDVNNASFERFTFDVNEGQTIKSVTAADWDRNGNQEASYITEGGHTGDYAGIHTADGNYEVTTYQLNQSVADGVYKASCYVKASDFSRTGSSRETSAGFYVEDAYVDIQKMGKLEDWTYIEIPEITVLDGDIQTEFYTYGAAGEYLMFDDVKIEYVGEVPDEVDANVVLEFDFSKTKTDGDTTTIYGVSMGEEITATAQNIEFETDEDLNDVAVFPLDGEDTETGITYTPGENDPMKKLTEGDGATISMWVKTAEDTLSSSLMAYGARQGENGSGDIGASFQLLARNNKAGDVVFYRNQSGSTGGHKIAGVGNPYKKDIWQLVTFVENTNGSGTIYVDGKELGTCAASDKTLFGYANDENTNDAYYFGFLPYSVDGDTHFRGSIDSITVYDGAMTEVQIKRLYEERMKELRQITLKADGNELLAGGAAFEFAGKKAYITGLGLQKDAAEATAEMTFKTDKDAKWNLDVYYLDAAEAENVSQALVVTFNGDKANAITFDSLQAKSQTDPRLASVASVKGISLGAGTNTVVFGNPNGTAPSLVKVVLTRTDVAAALEVEDMIMRLLITVDNYEQIDTVLDISKRYHALSKEEQAMISADAYEMLVKAEGFMASYVAADQKAADSVTASIQALGTITLDKKNAVAAARAAYNALNDRQKTLVSAETLAKLTGAEETIKKLQSSPSKPQISLSVEETEIADKLGVTPQTAKEISKVAADYSVSKDTLYITEKSVAATKSDGDIKGSSFAAIQAKVSKQTKNSIKLSWNKVKGADGYLVFGNKCGKKNAYVLKKNITNAKTTSYTDKKLKKNTYYKYVVVAYKNVGTTKVTLASSKTIYETVKGGKYGNIKSVSAKKSSIKLSKKKTFNMGAKVKKAGKKTASYRGIKYESSDPKIASVNSKGKITAKKKGKCDIYAYAQNGMCRKLKVTVR